MADYNARFILNPTKIVWFIPFLCVDERQRITQSRRLRRECMSPLSKKKVSFLCHMYWVLIKKGVDGGGNVGGHKQGLHQHHYGNEREEIESIMAAPCESTHLQNPAFVSRRKAEPIRVSITVTFSRGNQSAFCATSAVTRACRTTCFPDV